MGKLFDTVIGLAFGAIAIVSVFECIRLLIDVQAILNH